MIHHSDLCGARQGGPPTIPVFFTLAAVAFSFISTFFAYGYTRYKMPAFAYTHAHVFTLPMVKWCNARCIMQQKQVHSGSKALIVLSVQGLWQWLRCKISLVSLHVCMSRQRLYETCMAFGQWTVSVSLPLGLWMCRLKSCCATCMPHAYQPSHSQHAKHHSAMKARSSTLFPAGWPGKSSLQARLSSAPTLCPPF